MTTPKQALEGLIEAVTRDADEPGGRGISGYTSARLSDAKAALASLQGEDAVERVARLVEPRPFEDDYPPGSIGAFNAQGRKERAYETARAILATGLVPDEAAIRADEREKCETGAIHDIAAERKRQREVEGWTLEHDDGHDRGELAAAAACYAVGRCIVEGSVRISERRLTKNLWPWSLKWWKPKGRRRNLVRAATLIVAEIERIDRAAAIRSGGGQ